MNVQKRNPGRKNKAPQKNSSQRHPSATHSSMVSNSVDDLPNLNTLEVNQSHVATSQSEPPQLENSVQKVSSLPSSSFHKKTQENAPKPGPSWLTESQNDPPQFDITKIDASRISKLFKKNIKYLKKNPSKFGEQFQPGSSHTDNSSLDRQSQPRSSHCDAFQRSKRKRSHKDPSHSKQYQHSIHFGSSHSDNIPLSKMFKHLLEAGSSDDDSFHPRPHQLGEYDSDIPRLSMQRVYDKIQQERHRNRRYSYDDNTTINDVINYDEILKRHMSESPWVEQYLNLYEAKMDKQIKYAEYLEKQSMKEESLKINALENILAMLSKIKEKKQ